MWETNTADVTSLTSEFGMYQVLPDYYGRLQNYTLNSLFKLYCPAFLMKTSLNKTQAKEKIESFFQKERFSKEDMKKIKRIAMKFRIPLKQYKKLFCKKCLSHLKGSIRISKTHKTIICDNCSFRNKFRMQ